MKYLQKTLAAAMAAAVAVSTLSLPALAATAPTYLVGGVSGKYYLTNDDGYVDMSRSASNLPYGQAAYYPLLNQDWVSKGGNASLTQAAKALNDAGIPLGGFSTDVVTKSTAWKVAMDAEAPLVTAENTLKSLQTAAAALKTTLDQANATLKTAQDNVTTAKNNVTTAEADVASAKTAQTAAKDALSKPAGGATDGALDVATTWATAVKGNATIGAANAAAVDAFMTALNAMLNAYTDLTTAPTAIDVSNLQASLNALTAAVDAHNATIPTPADPITAPAPKTVNDIVALKTAIFNADKRIADAEADVNLKKALVTPLEDAVVPLTAAQQTANNNFTNSDYAKAGGDTALANATTAVAQAKNKTAAAQAAYQTAVTDYNTKASAYNTARTAYKTVAGVEAATGVASVVTVMADPAQAITAANQLVTAVKALGTFTSATTLASPASYAMVYEADAVSSARAKPTWQQNGTLVEKTEIVKRRMYVPTSGAASIQFTTDYGSPSQYTGTRSYAYFLSVKLKTSTTTKTQDIYGPIALSKSGSNGFASFTTDLFLSATYNNADSSGTNNVIPIKSTVFKKGNGFDENEDEEFRFECEDDAYFIVNTMGQGSILLAANNDYNNTIANKYSSANLDFFNGNGATFNKTGELNIPADSGSYLYKVNTDGTLSEAKSTYDAYEDAFKVKTRTLGQYVISDTRLKIQVVEEDVIVPIVPDVNNKPSTNPPTGAIA